MKAAASRAQMETIRLAFKLTCRIEVKLSTSCTRASTWGSSSFDSPPPITVVDSKLHCQSV